MNILWTAHATNCLVEIEDFIALDNPVAAQRWTQQLIQRTEVLAEHPHAGRNLPEMPQNKLRE
jgi:plasmid stabilization system protein ParE